MAGVHRDLKWWKDAFVELQAENVELKELKETAEDALEKAVAKHKRKIKSLTKAHEISMSKRDGWKTTFQKQIATLKQAAKTKTKSKGEAMEWSSELSLSPADW